jgi:hypothetical protein
MCSIVSSLILNLATTKSGTWPLRSLARPRPKFANRHLSNRQRPNGDGAERQGADGCCTKCDRTLTPHGGRSSLGPSYRAVCGHLTLLIIYHPRTSTLSG